ncbi:MAG TPA: sigma-70 family RNA polymerase sigma factor [bacterium]|nr:sigma-70 family RNA polymerase sigma factor [bacterium]HPN31185.1 sigma-70 family RNA polymerase sigma factor [bacterium]
MNNEQFADIIEQTKGVVISALKQYLNKNLYDKIDDIVQDVYFKVYKQLVENKFLGESKLSTWIYVISKNEALGANRKFYREIELKKRAGEDYLLNDYDSAETEEETAVKFGKVRQIIMSLPSKYKSVLSLFIQGKKEKQIAEELSIAQGTVKSRLSRGKQIVQRIFVKTEEWNE